MREAFHWCHLCENHHTNLYPSPHIHNPHPDLAVLMLTGQGQPTGELSLVTKCVVVITAVASVAMFAIPSSMLTWGFEAEAERLAARAFRRRRRHRRDGVANPLLAGVEASAISSTSDSDHSSNSEWVEYERIIAGDGDDSTQIFRQFDKDESGGLDMNEFIRAVKGMKSDRIQSIEREVLANGRKIEEMHKAITELTAKVTSILELG